MIPVPVHTLEGQVSGQIEVQEEVFGVQENVAVLHQAVVRQQANQRLGTAATKTRAEVAGSGRKLYPQKHTGRARAGSRRAAQRRGSGAVFGPHPRDYRQAMPRKMRRLALRCALSAKLREGEMVVVEGLQGEFKTRDMARVLDRLEALPTALVVTEQAETGVVRAAQNLPGVKTLPAPLLNVLDILNHRRLVMTVGAVRKAQELWGRQG